MESLPSDVLSVVLHKLAVQDPRSLLQATCACKTFHREADNTRGIWKEAFYGGDSRFGDHCKDENVEAEILTLGGYKQLVRARWAVPGGLFPEQKQGGGSVTGNGGSANRDSSAGEYKLNKHLVVLREKGRLLLWGLLLQDRPEVLRELGDFAFKYALRGLAPDKITFGFFSSRLEPVSSKDGNAVLLQMKLAGHGRVLQRLDLDLEIYNFMKPVMVSKDVTSRDSWSWACDLDYEGRG